MGFTFCKKEFTAIGSWRWPAVWDGVRELAEPSVALGYCPSENCDPTTSEQVLLRMIPGWDFCGFASKVNLGISVRLAACCEDVAALPTSLSLMVWLRR